MGDVHNKKGASAPFKFLILEYINKYLRKILFLLELHQFY